MAVPVGWCVRRLACAGGAVSAIAAALLAGAGAAGGAAGAEPAARDAAPTSPQRAAILFLPWPDAAGGDRALLAQLGERRRGLAVGLTSATVGGYSPRQMALDLSQGTRLPLGLYGGPPAPLEFEPLGSSGRAVVSGWRAARARAARAPGDIEPGLLGEAVLAGGGRVAYAGVSGASTVEAAVAADRLGRVGVASISTWGALEPRLRSLWRDADLLVARLPSGERGLAALDRLLATRAPDDLFYVVRAPPPPAGRPPLLATGIAAAGFEPGGGIGSDTTRRSGLIAATDVAPTVLGRLGFDVPAAMGGQPIEARAGPAGAGAVVRLHDRLRAIAPGRVPALLGLLAGWLATLAGLALARGRAGVRTGLRLGLLVALWFPALALATAAPATAALDPLPGWVEPMLLALGSLMLAAATDRILPWPRGPALPAAAASGAYAVDLAFGSPLTALALTGPNPGGGARFFGVGNELEALLSVSLLVGVGAAASRTGLRPAGIAAAFATAGLVAVAILGSGRLGADVGAAVTLGAGAAVAAASALDGGSRRRVVALALLAPAAALGALALLDALTGADAHLSRTVLSARPGGLLESLERRAATQSGLLGSVPGAAVAAVALAVLGVLVVRRRELLAPLTTVGGGPLAAGLTGAMVAILVGALANDSAPDMLAIGAVLALLAVGYVRGPPEMSSRRASGDRPRALARPVGAGRQA